MRAAAAAAGQAVLGAARCHCVRARLWSPAGGRRLVTTPLCGAGKRQRGGAPKQQREEQQSEAGGEPKQQLARSVRAMPIKVISVSKSNSAGANAFTDEWLEKLRRYTSAEVVTVKPNPLKARDVDVAKAAEAQKVLSHISPRDRVVLLDERGKEVSSEGVAEIIAAAGDDGAPLVFCIGGPFGHGPAVVERADTSIRLSRLVLNHSVALVLLAEQLYRGWTILDGSPYHH